LARKPAMDEALLKSIIARMVERGFKESEIQIVPQKW
jgi:lipocalin